MEELRINTYIQWLQRLRKLLDLWGMILPIAVLSDKYRPLSHFFRQKFSQVTNPPIDSIERTESSHEFENYDLEI